MPGCCKGTAPVPYQGTLYVADRYATGEIYAFAGPEWPRVLPGRTLVNESTDLGVLGEYSDDPIADPRPRRDADRHSVPGDGGRGRGDVHRDGLLAQRLVVRLDLGSGHG
jgi:hypothetical protein